MPKQKDLKRLVRSRMEKTGESYTAARLQLVRKAEPAPDYAALAGMSDDAVKKQTGRDWSEWTRILDREGSAEKPHREIAAFVASLGTPSWWSQTVTVGYERIRGLRERGQRRSGTWEASKSRTYNVPLETLYDSFANGRLRKKWLTVAAELKSAAKNKRIRLAWPDGTTVQVGFLEKGEMKSSVAIQHEKLPDRAAADAKKKEWSEHFDRLAEVLAK